MFPTWIFVVVAAGIAGAAFAIGQVLPGFGVPFAVLASTMWTAFSVHLQRIRARG